jgi:hypothetical protein
MHTEKLSSLPGSARRPRFILFPLANAAKPIDLKFVALYLKTVLSGYIVLQCFDPLVLELEDLPAPRANEMIVMPTVGRFIFIPRKTVLEPSFFGDPRFGKKLQSPIDGRITDAWLRSFDEGIQFLRAQVPSGVHESLEDRVTLARGFEALSGKILG